MRRFRLLSLLVALGLLVAACGDDDSSTETSTDEASSSTTGAAEAGDDGEGLSEEEQDELAEGLGECGFLTEFATAFDEFDPTAGMTGEEPVDFGQMFAPIAEAAQQVADDAPEEIQDAFQTLADGFTTVAEELEGVVVDMSDPQNIDPEAMAALEDMDASFGAEFDAAGAEIDTWMQEHCADFAEALDLNSFGG